MLIYHFVDNNGVGPTQPANQMKQVLQIDILEIILPFFLKKKQLYCNNPDVLLLEHKNEII